MKNISVEKIKFRLLRTVTALKSRMAAFARRVLGIRIKGADAAVAAGVLVLSCLIIVPSVVTCANNRSKAACEEHMFKMLSILSDELNAEAQSGGTYLRDLFISGNYQKLISSINDKTGESKKYPASNYYVRPGDGVISIICKKHKDVSEKEFKISAMPNVSVDVAQKPMIGEKVVYLAVTGPDTYYMNDSLDEKDPEKMKFVGREADDVIQNLKVSAVYAGGVKKEIPRSAYTVFTDELDMTRAGQTHLIIKCNPTSVWDNSAYVPFVITVIGEEDIAPLIVDGGINGRFELAAWEWADYLEEASEQKDGKDFDASIIFHSGKFYYYPDGLHIINSSANTTPLKYALDIDDHTKPAYCIPFDTDSVILNSSDEEKIHNGSLKVENDLVYIWQDVPSKELPEGWIRVYCELRKY